MEEERKVHKVLMGNSKEGNHWKDRVVDGRMASEWIVRKTG
jgi:hypothetical protein